MGGAHCGRKQGDGAHGQGLPALTAPTVPNDLAQGNSTLSRADVIDSGFGVAVSYDPMMKDDVYVDHMRMTVHYCAMVWRTLTILDDDTPPTATNTTQTKGYTEGASTVALDDIVVTDPDTGDTITATLTLANTATGTLTTAATARPIIQVPGCGPVSIGSERQLWPWPAVAFTPATNNDLDTTITVNIHDAANTGPSNGTITLDVTPVNDAPTATNMTQTKTYTEGASSVALDNIVVTDPDTGDTITATLTLENAGAGI